MLKKTITYVDYDGNERVEDHFFNLSRAEVVDMEMSIQGGLTAMVKKIIAAQDNVTLYKTFKDMILASYGEKSLDGKRFVKIAPDGHRLVDDFIQTEAYSVLLMELVQNSEAASDFFNKIMPTEPQDHKSK